MDFFEEQFQAIDAQTDAFKKEYAELINSNYLEIKNIDEFEC